MNLHTHSVKKWASSTGTINSKSKPNAERVILFGETEKDLFKSDAAQPVENNTASHVYKPINPKNIVKAQKAAKKAARKAENAEEKRRKKWEHDITHNKDADPIELAKIQKQKALRKAGRHAAIKPATVSLTVATSSLVGFAMTGVPFFLVPLGTSLWAGLQLSGQSYSKAKADMNANYDKYLEQSKSQEAKKMQPELDFDEPKGLIKKSAKALIKKIKKG